MFIRINEDNPFLPGKSSKINEKLKFMLRLSQRFVIFHYSDISILILLFLLWLSIFVYLKFIPPIIPWMEARSPGIADKKEKFLWKAVTLNI